MVFKYIIIILLLLYFIRLIILITRIKLSSFSRNCGFINNKKIKYDEVAIHREIPFNGNFWYANALMFLNNSNYKKSNILSAVMLKWITNEFITIEKENEKTIFVFKKQVYFKDYMEKVIYNLLYDYTDDGKMTIKNFKKCCKKKYIDFCVWFDGCIEREIENMEQNNLIRHRASKKECKKKYVLLEQVYADSLKLLGLKKYLDSFGKMKNKELLDVRLWDNYLIYSCLFGNAKKIMNTINANNIENINMITNVTDNVITLFDKLLFYTMDVVSIKYFFGSISLFGNSSHSELFDAVVNEVSKPIDIVLPFGSSDYDSYDKGGHSRGGGGGGSFGGGGSMGGR